MKTEMMELNIAPEAAAMVRLEFLPPNNEHARRIKTLAAALISECMMAKMSGVSDQARAASIAITHIETGAMFAVKSVT